MINSEPLSIMTQTIANRPPPSYAPNNYQQSQYNVNPTTRLTIEQLQNQLNQYQQPTQQQQQNDPYTSGSILLSQCSDLVRSKIILDQRYQQIDSECEMLVKQFIYANVIPQVLGSQQGRIAFEKWEHCIKELKQEYSKEEVAMTQNMNILLSDPVVAARLQELQNQQQETPPQVSQQEKQYKGKKQQQNIQQNIEETGDI